MKWIQQLTTSMGGARASVAGAVACGVLMILPMAGCASADKGSNHDDTASAGTTATAATTADGAQSAKPAQTADQQLSDGEILGVIKMANEAEVVTSQLAVQKATAPEVREFAQQMIDEHGEADLKVDQTAAAAEPASESEKASTIADEAKRKIESLNGQTGAAFDRAYLESQVKMHQDVLATIQDELLPDAESAEVRQLLETLRGDVQQHLAKAEQLRQGMASAAG